MPLACKFARSSLPRINAFGVATSLADLQATEFGMGFIQHAIHKHHAGLGNLGEWRSGKQALNILGHCPNFGGA